MQTSAASLYSYAKNFLQLVGIAILIAVPLAWWAGNKWLQDFAFRIPVQLYVFIVTAIITVLIALCTVGYHAIRVALDKPGKKFENRIKRSLPLKR